MKTADGREAAGVSGPENKGGDARAQGGAVGARRGCQRAGGQRRGSNGTKPKGCARGSHGEATGKTRGKRGENAGKPRLGQSLHGLEHAVFKRLTSNESANVLAGQVADMLFGFWQTAKSPA